MCVGNTVMPIHFRFDYYSNTKAGYYIFIICTRICWCFSRLWHVINSTKYEANLVVIPHISIEKLVHDISSYVISPRTTAQNIYCGSFINILKVNKCSKQIPLQFFIHILKSYIKWSTCIFILSILHLMSIGVPCGWGGRGGPSLK